MSTLWDFWRSSAKGAGEDISPTIDLACTERESMSMLTRGGSRRVLQLTKTLRVCGERDRLDGEAIRLFSLFATSRASLTRRSLMWVRNRPNGVVSS